MTAVDFVQRLPGLLQVLGGYADVIPSTIALATAKVYKQRVMCKERDAGDRHYRRETETHHRHDDNTCDMP
jgi:hypothetical protein